MTGITPHGIRRATHGEIHMVRRLAARVGDVGDGSMAALCDRALAGSLTAWDEVSERLRIARYGEYKDPPTWGPGDGVRDPDRPDVGYWEDLLPIRDWTWG